MLVVALLLFHASPQPIEGSYVALTMNGGALPAEMHIPVSESGDFRLVRLEQGVLRLTDDRRFTLYFRYYHQLVQHGHRPVSTPVLSDSETGTFQVQAGRLILTPTKKKGRRSRPPVTATILGDDIKATYLLENGSSQQRVSLTLRRDASFW